MIIRGDPLFWSNQNHIRMFEQNIFIIDNYLSLIAFKHVIRKFQQLYQFLQTNMGRQSIYGQNILGWIELTAIWTLISYQHNWHICIQACDQNKSFYRLVFMKVIHICGSIKVIISFENKSWSLIKFSLFNIFTQKWSTSE